MTAEQDPKVTRYCPECGKKFVAAQAMFESPRICPNCKTRVLFRDYGKEVPPDFVVVDEDLQQRNPTVDRWLVAIISVSIFALLLFSLIALVLSQLGALFVLSMVMLALGVVGAAVSLETLGRLKSARLGYVEARRRLSLAECNLQQYVGLFTGLKKNFDTLVEEKRALILAELKADMDAVNLGKFDLEIASNELASQRLAIEQESAQLDGFKLAIEKELKQKLDEELRIRKQQLSQEQAQVYEGYAQSTRVSQETASLYQKAAGKMCDRYLTEVRKLVKSKLNANNFAQQQQKFLDAVNFCDKQGYPVPAEIIASFMEELRNDFQQAVRTQLAKEEQAKIREQLRDEQQAERELERELKRIEAEERAIEKALAEALLRTNDEHSAEVEELRRRLADAEARAERTKSMAQMTKAGNVYVISNVGAFGEDVFKIGMTRRLDPMDRVHELGDASVPFPFDVHMMISSENAPALEGALHRAFHTRRVNRVNFRKEFFRVGIEEIAAIVQQNCGQVDYVADPEALQYRESMLMTEAEFAFLSSQVDPETLPED